MRDEESPQMHCCADSVRKKERTESAFKLKFDFIPPNPNMDRLSGLSIKTLSITLSVRFALLFFKDNMFLIKIKTLRQVMK